MRHVLCSMADHNIHPDAESIEHFLQGKRIMVTLPPFHGAGLAMYLFWAIIFRAIPIAPAAVGIVTAQGLLEALEQTPAEVAFLVPSVVVELAQNLELLESCAKYLKVILYAGGDLPQSLGDRVAARIRLRCWWGATESGLPQQLVPPGLGPQDWRYIRYHPVVGATFDEVADNTYELVMKRDETFPQVHFSLGGQEHLQEYRTKDLFEPHPTVPDAWCWRARSDDIIVFLNGEKTNPVSFEQHIVAHNPEVATAIVIGTQRFQAALLIDTVPYVGELNTRQKAELIEKIWPSVQEANRVAPAHARVEKALVLILPADRPIIRAGKGTVQRAASVDQYAKEIERLYADADVVDGEYESIQSSHGSAGRDSESIRCFIKESIKSVTGWTNLSNGDASTFFDQGMDSLMALQLLRTLRRGLNRPDLGMSTIYSNPSIAQLQALLTDQSEPRDDDTSRMESLLKTYRDMIHQIPRPASHTTANNGEPLTALLTGSTGAVGTHLLQSLRGCPRIRHIVCLNRAQDGGRTAQRSLLAASGLGITKETLDRRVIFLQADLSQPFLGLKEAVYQDLCAQVGLIIHNAWPVNFNLGLPAFEPQLAGVVNIARFASKAVPSPANVVFISSVGAIGNLASQLEPNRAGVPENIFTSLDTPYASGYARSKFLAELLYNTASQHLGTSYRIVRVGQVSGAVRRAGVWNTKEWFPSLVRASAQLGCLPDEIGGAFANIDWLPVDVVADVVVDLALCAGSGETEPYEGAQVFNLRNPHTTTWQFLLPAALKALEAEAVKPSTWLARLEAEAAKDGDEAKISGALKLIDFYRDVLWVSENGESQQLPMEIGHSLAKSATLREVQAVNPEWIEKWVGEWMATAKTE